MFRGSIGPVLPELLDSLQRVGAAEQVSVLVARLPTAAMFEVFLEQREDADRFRFGREADGTPAASWDWGVLD